MQVLPLIRDRSPKLFSMWEHVLAARICLDRKRSELQEIVRVERESKISIALSGTAADFEDLGILAGTRKLRRGYTG